MRWPMSRRGAGPTATEAVGETPADPVSSAIEVDEIDQVLLIPAPEEAP